MEDLTDIESQIWQELFFREIGRKEGYCRVVDTYAAKRNIYEELEDIKRSIKYNLNPAGRS